MKDSCSWIVYITYNLSTVAAPFCDLDFSLRLATFNNFVCEPTIGDERDGGREHSEFSVAIFSGQASHFSGFAVFQELRHHVQRQV